MSFLPSLRFATCFQNQASRQMLHRKHLLNTILRNREGCEKSQAWSGFRGFPQHGQTCGHRPVEARMLYQPWGSTSAARRQALPSDLNQDSQPRAQKFLQAEGRTASKDQFSCLHLGHHFTGPPYSWAPTGPPSLAGGLLGGSGANHSLRHFTLEALSPGPGGHHLGATSKTTPTPTPKCSHFLHLERTGTTSF